MDLPPFSGINNLEPRLNQNAYQHAYAIKPSPGSMIRRKGMVVSANDALERFFLGKPRSRTPVPTVDPAGHGKWRVRGHCDLNVQDK
jgi:hypothetical protein